MVTFEKIKQEILQKLNLPDYSFRISETDGRKQIFDSFRKKYVVLTPEEWVRQNFLMYLITDKKVPRTVISVEAGLKLYSRKKRTDIVVYNRSGKPEMIIECKAPEVAINEKVFDQVVRYNMALNVNYFILTNGINHYCCRIDYTNNTYRFLNGIPDYDSLFTS